MLPKHIDIISKRIYSSSIRLCSSKSAAIIKTQQLKKIQDAQTKKFLNDPTLTETEIEKDRFAAPQRLPTHQPTTLTLDTEPKQRVNLGLTEAVKLEIKAYEILNSLTASTDLYQFKDSVKASIDTFNKALKASPHVVQLPHLYHGIGLCYTRLTDFNKVIEYNQLALDVDPDFVPAYESMGEAFQMLKEYKLALGWYTKFYDTFIEYYSAIDEKTKNSKTSEEILGQLLFKRGVCYYEIYDYEMAAGDFNTVVELDSRSAYTALNWLGRIAMEHGKYWDCVSLNSKAIAKNPKCLAAYYDRNAAYELLGKSKEADEDMKMFNYVKREKIFGKISMGYTPSGAGLIDDTTVEDGKGNLLSGGDILIKQLDRSKRKEEE
jgi:tetratricopeptide (TPR) repeat protein